MKSDLDKEIEKEKLISLVNGFRKALSIAGTILSMSDLPDDTVKFVRRLALSEVSRLQLNEIRLFDDDKMTRQIFADIQEKWK